MEGEHNTQPDLQERRERETSRVMSAAVSSTGVLVSEAAIIRTSRRLFPIISPAPAPKSMGMEMLWCAVYYRLLDDVENRGWRSLTLLKLQ